MAVEDYPVSNIDVRPDRAESPDRNVFSDTGGIGDNCRRMNTSHLPVYSFEMSALMTASATLNFPTQASAENFQTLALL